MRRVPIRPVPAKRTLAVMWWTPKLLRRGLVISEKTVCPGFALAVRRHLASKKNFTEAIPRPVTRARNRVLTHRPGPLSSAVPEARAADSAADPDDGRPSGPGCAAGRAAGGRAPAAAGPAPEPEPEPAPGPEPAPEPAAAVDPAGRPAGTIEMLAVAVFEAPLVLLTS